MCGSRRSSIEVAMQSTAVEVVRHMRNFILVTFLAGCSHVQVQTGARPNIASLESNLRVGESTMQDVRYFLGTPFGQGRDMLPIATQARALWIYYYAEESISTNRQLFLFVFFDGDRYDGYLWFSSLPE
jgi:hypothetical protein